MSINKEKAEHHHHHIHGEHGHCSCGCHGHKHDDEITPIESVEKLEKLSLTNSQISVLVELKHCNYLPISRFMMSSSVEEEAVFVALAPVYLTRLDESMEDVKSMGAIFAKLAEQGLISLDYDIPLNGYDYSLYTESLVYKHFEQTVAEGKNQEKFLCDIATIELGSMALTELGERVVKRIIAEYVNK